MNQGSTASALVLGALVALGSPSLAHAQAPPAETTPATGVAWDKANAQQTARATQAYKAGVAALNGKHHDVALAKFRESYGIVASPNSRLMIVRVLNESGRPLEAYREGLLARVEAERASEIDPTKYARAIEGVDKELEAAAAHIGLLTVTVVGAPEGSRLTVAGAAIDPSAWGEPLPLAPGEVEVVLTTPAGNARETLSLAAGSAEDITLSPPKAAAPPPAPSPAPAPVVAEGSYRGPDRRLMAYIAGGVGVLGFIGFGTFGLLSNGRFDRIDSACPDADFCDPDLEDEADTGRTYQVVANVSLVIGVLGIAAGAGLFTWDLLDPPAEQARAPLRPRFSIGPAGAALGGSF